MVDINRQLWRTVALLTAVVALGALFQRLPKLVMTLDDARFATAIYLGMLFALPVAGMIWGRQAWRAAQLWQSTRSAAHSPIILQVATIVGLVGLAAFVVAHAFAAPTQIRIFHARQLFNHYTITADPAAGIIQINGPIGPNLPAKLARTMARNPTIHTIEITSDSGLLEEAMSAAALIEKQRATVIARKTCTGSCLPILLAGARRYADWDMSLGVDQIRNIAVMRRSVDLNRVIQTAVEADGYLNAKGLPKNMRFYVRSADARGLVSQPAIRLTEERVLDGIKDGNQVISPTAAKWRTVEQHVQRSDTPGLQSILTAARGAGSTFVESHAETLYAATLAGDPARLRDSICGLASSLAYLHVETPACSN